jgi:hypothetical protein
MTNYNELKELFVLNTGRTTIAPYHEHQTSIQIYGYQPSRSRRYVWQGDGN